MATEVLVWACSGDVLWKSKISYLMHCCIVLCNEELARKEFLVQQMQLLHQKMHMYLYILFII